MTLQNNVRTQQTTLSSTLVRIVCVTLSFVSFGIALLGLGLTCFLLGEIDRVSAPCPNRLTVGVFGGAGGLLALGLLLLVIVCRKRRRLKKEALLEELPPRVCGVEGGGSQYKKKFSGEGVAPLQLPDAAGGMAAGAPQTEPLANGAEDSYEMTQKSADVSYWIEQQTSEGPATSDSFHLQPADGATSGLSDPEDAEGEMTAL